MAGMVPSPPAGEGGGGRPATAGGGEVDTVVFFDIDGTLLRPGVNRVHEEAFTHAFETVFGVAAHIHEIPHQGMTDKWIIEVMMQERHGIPAPVVAERMDAATAAMTEYCRARAEEVVVEVLPGVVPLLSDLSSRPNVALGLVTGNLEEIGWGKIRAAGLSRYFHTGGFGSDHTSRAELIRIGLDRVRAAQPHLPPRDRLNVFHIGDTLHDVNAARAAGVYGIGVATGTTSYESLALNEHRPYAAVRDMTDTSGMLKLLRLA